MKEHVGIVREGNKRKTKEKCFTLISRGRAARKEAVIAAVVVASYFAALPFCWITNLISFLWGPRYRRDGFNKAHAAHGHCPCVSRDGVAPLADEKAASLAHLPKVQETLICFAGCSRTSARCGNRALRYT